MAASIPAVTTSTIELVFVDSNILIYARDARHPAKQEQATAWMTALWRSQRGRLRVQVLAEFYVSATQKLRPGLDPETAQGDVRALFTWRPVVADVRVFDLAWDIQQRYRFSFWDAMILGAASVEGCRYLLTEDLQDGQEVAGIRVLSPFLANPDDIGI
jgi:predicted nucleic acid-binding protein